MKKYRYKLVYNKEFINGKIKALTYELAREKIKRKYSKGEISCLRVYRANNFILHFFHLFLANIASIVFKIVPIAFGILLIYFMLNKCSL